eukprot:jgi/Undpi1/10386/HiC_scaffold_29.g12836.m1
MASFRVSQAEGKPVYTDTSRRVRGTSVDGATSDDEDEQQEISQEQRDNSVIVATFADQPQDTEATVSGQPQVCLHRLAGNTASDARLPCGGLEPSISAPLCEAQIGGNTPSTSIPLCEDQPGPKTRCHIGSSDREEGFRLSCASTTTTSPSQRRETFTLAKCTDDEVLGRSTTAASDLLPRSLDAMTGACHGLAGDTNMGVCQSSSDGISRGHGKVTAEMGDQREDSGGDNGPRAILRERARAADGLIRHGGKREDTNEAIWRASLSGSTRPPHPNNHSKEVRDQESVDSMFSTLKNIAWPSTCVNSSSALTEVDGVTVGGAEKWSPRHDEGAGNTLAMKPRLEKPPGEDLASVLLSDHNFVGGKLSAAHVLEHAKTLGKPSTQPFPDLPYGFTDLGKRLNVEHDQRGGGSGAYSPNVGVMVARASGGEGEALEKET